MGEGRNITEFIEEPELHGGAMDLVRAAYPNAALPWIDLSTGISPVAYPVAELDASVWSALPLGDQERALLEAAAERYGAKRVSQLVAAPGTQAVISLLPRLFERCRVAIVGPTYGEHERCWARAGFDVSVCVDLDDALATRPGVLVVVNPNNPTGRVYSGERLRAAAEEFAPSGATLVVDEAFADLCGEEVSLVPAAPDNAIVLRSFGKTYGLAGLRLGFAIGSDSFAQRLRSELGPWAVSGPALEIGRRALSDEPWLDALRSRLEADSQRLQGVLRQTGFVIVGSTSLFVLGSIENAKDVRDQLARGGIHVRHFPHDPTWLRFGIPADETVWGRLEENLFDLSETKP